MKTTTVYCIVFPLPILHVVKLISISAALMMVTALADAQESDYMEPKRNFGLEISTGLQGSFSFAQIGVNYSPLKRNFWIGLKFREMSSITWVSFTNMQTNETVSFHPLVLAGILTMGGSSKQWKDLYRVYGYSEVLIGHSSTPYDSYFYDVPNLIGDNVTYGIFGLFGIEFFTSKRMSLFIESGGGYKSIAVDDEKNQYAIASGWIGSGVTLRMGTIIYLK